MFVWYLDRAGKLTPYRLQGAESDHCFLTREFANACAEQLVRERYTAQALVLNTRQQVFDVWRRHGWRVRRDRRHR
jgi:hypothetical protein